MSTSFWQAAGPLGILTIVGLLGCSHAAPASEPLPDNSALEAQARQDLGPDPFRELDAGAPAPRPAPMIAEAPPPADPRAQADAALQQVLHASDCAAILDAVRTNDQASPRAIRDALFAAEHCQERARDLRGARQTAQRLLLACGPEGVGRCRAQVLALWRKLARQPPKDSSLSAKAAQVAEKDACLAKAESQARSDKPLDSCLVSAEALYRAERDELMRARARLARARHALHKTEPGAEHLLAAAADACTEARCAAVRNQALEAYASWAASQKRLDTLLELRLRQDALSAEALPPAKREYVRSAKVDAACAAVDAAEGAGACRALEKRTTGTWTFHDWSAQDFPGDLPKEFVLRANDDYLPTLQDCFREQARRLPVPSSVRYPVRWMVTLDGRADQVHLDPPGDDSSPLAACLRARFATWRYPRSHGENQHVEQSFTVSATAH